MSRYKLSERDLERVTALPVYNLEIVTDSEIPYKVEIYWVDKEGQRIEGGTFDRDAFIDWVLRFYNDNL